MAVKTSKKDRVMEDLRVALGWPRMLGNSDGVYFSVDGARNVMEMLREMKGETAISSPKEEKVETPEEVSARIARRFEMLGKYTTGTVMGSFKSLIIQGPPGLGKTYSVEAVLDDYDPSGVNVTKVSGKMSAVTTCP